jgi:O-antigen/teichoic acid export membrane protein
MPEGCGCGDTVNGMSMLRSWVGQRVPGGHGSLPDSLTTNAGGPREHRQNSNLMPVLMNWVTKGSWAVMDQGLFAVSNFLLNVMLARWLTPSDYGAFTVAFSIFLFIGAAHFAMLIEPMLVFGPAKYAGRQAAYLDMLMVGHWALVAPASLGLLVSGAVLGLSRPGALSSALVGFAIAGPLILLTWLLRRACYLRFEPRLAALAGLMYLVLIVAGLSALYQQRLLSIWSALGLLVVASLITNLWLFNRLHIALPSLTSQGLFREMLSDHWGYGRWAVGTMLLMSAATGGEAYFLLLPIWHGLDASAALKALVNLTTPLRNTLIALGILILPVLARVRGTAGFGRLISLAMVMFVVGAVAYWVPLVLFHRPVLAWLYGGRYGEHVEVLWFLGVYLLTSSVTDVLGGGLRALERPDLIFRANILAAATAVMFGVWATARWGVIGAGAGIALASATRALAMWWYYRHPGETTSRHQSNAYEKLGT